MITVTYLVKIQYNTRDRRQNRNNDSKLDEILKDCSPLNSGFTVNEDGHYDKEPEFNLESKDNFLRRIDKLDFVHKYIITIKREVVKEKK